MHPSCHETATFDAFRFVADNMCDGVTIVDAHGNLTYLNQAAANMMGYETPADAMRSGAQAILSRFERFRPDGAPLQVDELPNSQAMRGRATDETLIGFRVKGTWEERWAVVRSVPIYDESQEVAGVVNFFREVTEERRDNEHRTFLLRATDELSSSLDYERTLATVAQLTVPRLSDWCAVDIVEDGRSRRLAIAHVDPSKLELVAEIERRYPADPNAAQGVPEVLRSGKADFIPDIPPEMLRYAAQNEEHLALIEKLQLKSYICVPLKVQGRILGAITMAMAESGRRYSHKDFELATSLADRSALAIDNARLFREVSIARETATLERDQSEHSFKLMVQSVKDYAIFMLDPNGYVMTWNEGAELINGYRPDEIIGRHFSCFYPADLIAKGACESTLAKTSEHGTFQEEGWRLRKDGSRFWASVVITSIRDTEGVLRGFAKVTRDLTERKRSKEELAAEARRREEAEQQARFVETFVGILGHDLRNPLSAIAMGAELLHAEGKATSNVVDRIARSTRRMSRMVTQLLDLTRSRLAGGIPIEPTATDLATIVRQVVDEIRLVHPTRTIELDAEVTVPGEWDADRLAQVVSNLLSNAAEHGAPDSNITVRLTSAQGMVTLSVHNSGPPIPAENIPLLFDPFKKVDRPYEPSKGLGLGLFITQQIVVGHGGTISCRSSVHEGTTFSVQLPLISQPALQRI